MAVLGTNLSGTNQATSEVPLPTVINDSCLTVNGQPVHMMFVSPTQVNAQMPAQAIGNVTLTMHTPGGVSNTFSLTVLTGRARGVSQRDRRRGRICPRSSATPTGWWSLPPIPCTAATF